MSPCRDSCKISSTYLHSTRPSYDQVVKNCLCHAFQRPCLHQCPCRCCDSWPAASQGSGRLSEGAHDGSVHGIRYLQVTIWWRYSWNYTCRDLKWVQWLSNHRSHCWGEHLYCILLPSLASDVPYLVRDLKIENVEVGEKWIATSLSPRTTRLKVSHIRKIKPKDHISMCFSRLAQGIPTKLRRQRLQHDWAADKIDATQTAGHPQLYKMPICCEKGLNTHRVHSSIYIIIRILYIYICNINYHIILISLYENSESWVPLLHLPLSSLNNFRCEWMGMSVARTWGSHCSVLVDLSVAGPWIFDGLDSSHLLHIDWVCDKSKMIKKQKKLFPSCFYIPTMFSSHPREAMVCIQGTTLAPPSVKRDMAMLAMLLDGLSWVVKALGHLKDWEKPMETRGVLGTWCMDEVASSRMSPSGCSHRFEKL